jgi:hypothetical protein
MSGKARTPSTPSTPSNITEEQIHQMLVDDKKRNEFGLFEFLNPYVQVPFERAQEEYKKKYKLKEAYDKQEFLRKMRTDIKREYLTRKKQLKRLQTDAAVIFREAEIKLQEHYSEEFARIKGRRAIDIDMPLVSCVEFREGETIDLKSFNIQQEFGDLLVMQKDIYRREREGVIQFMRKREEEEELLAQQQQQQQQQRQFDCEAAAANEASWGNGEWWNQTPPTPASHQTRGAFGGCYDDNDDEYYPGEHDYDWREACDAEERKQRWEEEQGESSSSYDSDYCAEFGYYPREYNYERQMRDDEEARVAQAARLRAEHEAEAAAEDAAEAERKSRWRELSHEEEQCLWFENTHDINDPWSDDDENDETEFFQEEHPCDEVIAPALSASAQSSHNHNNPVAKKKKATKARVAKQQQKKQQQQQQQQQANKFVPLQVTDNTNRTNEVTAILTANKLEINLPRKNLQNASREAIKRHNQKWNRINALAKQGGNARGTKIATLPDPRPWHNNDNDNYYSYEEYDC